MSRTHRLVVWPFTVTVIGVLVGMVLMGCVVALVKVIPQDNGGLLALGVLVVGALGAVGVGVGVWMGGLARASRQLYPQGRRLGVVIWSASAVLVLVVVVGLALEALARSGGRFPWVWVVGGALILAAPSAVFRLWDRAGEPTAEAASRSDPDPDPGPDVDRAG